MKILRSNFIPGPNVFNHKPVMTMTIDLERHIDVESSMLPDFVSRILSDLPGLHTHRCSRGHAGGFVERLKEGTYFGHIIEHIALELSEPAGLSAAYGKTVYDGAPGIYRIVVESQDAELSEHLLRTAFDYVQAALSGQPYDLESKLSQGRRIVERNALGPSTKAIVDAAIKRNIPWERINDQSLIQLGHGKNRRYIQATQSWSTRSIAVEISCDKALTKEFLTRASIPVPYGKVVRSAEEAMIAWKDLGAQAAVKPLDGNQGKGVSLYINSPEAAAAAYLIAAEYSSRVIVEEMLTGDDYRLIVVGGKLVAASKRMAPSVTGDGHSTIAQLISRENLDPRRGDGHEKPMTKIPVDEIALNCLEKQGYSLFTVPDEGTVLSLRDNTNLSTGGKAIDVTDQVHPSIARICERAANAIGLDICGIDLLAEDISKPLQRSNGIVELNTAPGIRMHHFPSEGSPRDVGGAIVQMLFPKNEDARIPIFSVTGTNGKTTTTRMISHIMAATGKVVGTTTTGGIWIGGECITEGDTTGPRSARTILSDPSVEVAVLETARGGLMRNGLGYDWADVGVITNIQADHIGQDGIEDEDDILHVKALVAERVKAGGSIVLNAMDSRLAKLPEMRSIQKQKLERNIVYFSSDPHNEVLMNHINNGGTAYYLLDNWIYEAKGLFQSTKIVNVRYIASTFGGKALFQIENVLAAVAAARAQNVAVEVIAVALASFDNGKDNPGRLNMFKVSQGQVILDYGHNPAAFRAISAAIADRTSLKTAVIGLPGDRSQEMIEQAALAAGEGFDRIIIKEDVNLRGRASGETAEICLQAITGKFPHKECRIIADESKALQEAIRSMTKGETVVHFYDDLNTVMETLKVAGAVPSDDHTMVDLVAVSNRSVEKAAVANQPHRH